MVCLLLRERAVLRDYQLAERYGQAVSVAAGNWVSVNVGSHPTAAIRSGWHLEPESTQKNGNKLIAWGATTYAAWRGAGNRVMFRLDEDVYRKGFLAQAERPLSALWKKFFKRDDEYHPLVL